MEICTFNVKLLNLELYVSAAPSTVGESCWFGLQETGITGSGFYFRTTKPWADCKMKCSNEDGCLAFSFVNRTSECRLHNNIETEADAESAYYQKNCTGVSGK